MKPTSVVSPFIRTVQEFNENQATGSDPQTGKPRKNYWGYDPVVFFAPKASYSSSGGWASRNWSSGK